jgi:hypothetical protein
MGHYITAHKFSGEQTAYLSRDAFSTTNKRMYEALGCVESAYGIVSGNGCTIAFTEQDLQNALMWVEKHPSGNKRDDKEEVSFLKSCLKAVNFKGEILIEFA